MRPASSSFEVTWPARRDLACGGEIHGAAEVEQGGLAAAAASEKGGYLARGAFERNAAQGFDAALVDFGDFADGDGRHGYAPGFLRNEARLELSVLFLVT